MKKITAKTIQAFAAFILLTTSFNTYSDEKWQYALIVSYEVNNTDVVKKFIDKVNIAAEKGWEVHSYTHSNTTARSYDTYTALMRRRK